MDKERIKIFTNSVNENMLVKDIVKFEISNATYKMLEGKNVEEVMKFAYKVLLIMYYENNEYICVAQEKRKDMIYTEKIDINKDSIIENKYLTGINNENRNEEFKLEEKNFKYIIGFNNKMNFLDIIYSEKNDFFMNIIHENKIIEVEIIYSINKIVYYEIENFVNIYKNLIVEIVKNVGKKISDIKFNAEKYYLKKNEIKISKYNLNEIFDKVALANSSKIAISFRNTYCTYSELRSEIINLSNYLIENYDFKQKRIGVMMQRSKECIVSMLAIMRIGCAYIPIDLNFPEKRKKYIIKDSKLDLIITDDEVIAKEYEVKMFLFNHKNLVTAGKQEINVKIKHNDIAYIIYTSGTTGNPKGVMISHKSLIELKQHIELDLQINSQHIIGQFASISFDASIYEIFMAIFTGATLDIIDDDTKYNYRLFEEYINNKKITTILLPPAFLTHLCPDNIYSLKLLISGGAPLPISLEQLWGRKVKVINAYGPTECTICATNWSRGKRRGFYESVPIGRPIVTARVYIIGKNNQLLPPMLTGEICIGGSLVGKGYINNEKLSSEKFVIDILEPDEMMYRTGDYGRLLPHGEIEFCGRLDNQVKVRGIRIELDEIYNALLSIQGVTDAVVIIVNDPEENENICGYITCREQKVNVQQIKEELRKKIPIYMIPNFIIIVDKFILNTSGKIDVSVLPNPFDNIDAVEDDIANIEDDTLKNIIEVWKEVLGVKRINLKSNFFELGGTSLAAIRIITEIYNRYNLKMTIEEIYRYETVEQIYYNLTK